MYSFYADESGDIGLTNDWLVLLAIGFVDNDWSSIASAINELKGEFFPRWDLRKVEIKSVYLRRWDIDKPWPPNAFATLDEEKNEAFSDRLFELVYKQLPFEWTASAINIQELIKKHGVSKEIDLYLWAYKFLVERIEGWLAPPHGVDNLGRLFLDQQHQTLVGGKSHEAIIDDHYRHQNIGTGYLKIAHVIEQPNFMHSNMSPHIQIADVLAYNVLRQVRDGFDHPYSHYQRMLPKCRGYNTWYGGQMTAPYGLKIYP